VHPKASSAGLICHSPTLSPPVTTKHPMVKFQEMSLEQGTDGYGGKHLEKRRVLRPEW